MQEKEVKVYLTKNHDIVIGTEVLGVLQDVLKVMANMHPQHGVSVNALPLGFPIIQELMSFSLEDLGILSELKQFEGRDKVIKMYEEAVEQLKHPTINMNGTMEDVVKATKSKKDGLILN